VVVQNNGGSTVAQCVVQAATAAGLRSITITPERADWDHFSNHMQGLGASEFTHPIVHLRCHDSAHPSPQHHSRHASLNPHATPVAVPVIRSAEPDPPPSPPLNAAVVVGEKAAGKASFRKVVADFAALPLGINGSGGTAARIVTAALSPGATMVTYGCASGHHVALTTGALVARGITATGLSIDRVLSAMSKADKEAAVAEATGATRPKQLVAREEFADFSNALKRALAPGERQVVVVMGK